MKASVLKSLLIVVFCLAILYLGFAYYFNVWPFNYGWQAVALSSGEVYFGHLIWFPRVHLKDVWYIRNFTDQKGNVSQRLVPFSSLYWGPENTLYLEKKNIIWWANLADSSQVIRVIKLNKSLPPLPPVPSNSPSPSPTPKPASSSPAQKTPTSKK